MSKRSGSLTPTELTQFLQGTEMGNKSCLMESNSRRRYDESNARPVVKITTSHCVRGSMHAACESLSCSRGLRIAKLAVCDPSS